MDLHLSGKRVLITGASRGIGAAAARMFAAEGCALRLAARDRAALGALGEELYGDHDVDVAIHPVDLRRSEDIEHLADTANDCDVVINNAGDIPAGSIDKIDEQTWRRGWELKVFGYINLTRRVYARMKTRGGGVIINNIGAGGEAMDFNYITGCSANASLMAFTRALGSRSLHDKIRVVGINPGYIATERLVSLMQAHAGRELGDESRYPELLTGLPGGRAGKPEEIANLMAFLASDRSAYTTGVVFTVDGGLSAGGGGRG